MESVLRLLLYLSLIWEQVRLHLQRADLGAEEAASARTENWGVALDSGQQLLKSCVHYLRKENNIPYLLGVFQYT